MPPENFNLEQITALEEGLSSMKKMKPEMIRPVISFQDLKIECMGDPKLEKLFHIVHNDCYRYTGTVCEYNKILSKGIDDTEAFGELDARRSIIHNATMDSINALSRALGKAERDNSWIASFEGHRAKYAKWILNACYQEIETMNSNKGE